MQKIFLFFIFLFLTSCSQSIPDEWKMITQNNKLNDTSSSTPSEDKNETNKKVSKTINFLILGSDTRPGEKVSRSDSIIVALYDPKHQNVKLVSIMRDSYVEIPRYSKKFNKINLAYFLGGKELLKETIQKNFDISIDHTIHVDFQAFVKIVDLLVPEGIMVNVKQEMIDDMHLDLKAGNNILHGKELLSYVRFRHDRESDFGRVRRQQEIIIVLKDKLQEKLTSFDGLAKFPGIVEESLNYVYSDISLEDMFSISSKMILYPVEKIETIRIPINGGYVNKRYNHSGEVLQLDIQKNRQVLEEFLKEPKPVSN